MSKKLFRSPKRTAEPVAPSYPNLEQFDRGRRDFLSQFGAAVLGAGALGTLLSACGDRPAVNAQPDQGMVAGGAPAPDAKIDTRPPQPPDGAAPAPDARIDKPDQKVKYPDGNIAGGAPAPDAMIDKPDQQASPGFAPPMDAAIDDGECPAP